MITSSELYWLLKLDAFRSALGELTLATMLITAAITTVIGFSCIDNARETIVAAGKRAMKVTTLGLVLAVIFYGAKTFLPTTKEAAVIYGAPAILDSQLVKEDMPKEAKEIYQLAKTWLKEKSK